MAKIPAAGRSETAEPATLFALLFAVAALLHIVWPPVFQLHPTFVPPPTWLLTGLVLAAVAVFHRPASVGRLLCLAGVQLLDVAYHLPGCAQSLVADRDLELNHPRRGRGRFCPGPLRAVQLAELYQTLRPSVRLSAVIFYFFTFFHKFNYDFMNPSISCASDFLKR